MLNKVLNALRETQLEQGQQIDELRREMHQEIGELRRAGWGFPEKLRAGLVCPPDV